MELSSIAGADQSLPLLSLSATYGRREGSLDNNNNFWACRLRRDDDCQRATRSKSKRFARVGKYKQAFVDQRGYFRYGQAFSFPWSDCPGEKESNLGPCLMWFLPTLDRGFVLLVVASAAAAATVVSKDLLLGLEHGCWFFD